MVCAISVIIAQYAVGAKHNQCKLIISLLITVEASLEKFSPMCLFYMVVKQYAQLELCMLLGTSTKINICVHTIVYWHIDYFIL